MQQLSWADVIAHLNTHSAWSSHMAQLDVNMTRCSTSDSILLSEGVLSSGETAQLAECDQHTVTEQYNHNIGGTHQWELVHA